ncbi:MAG: signal peptidase I [Deltaproteobacteria bacterium]
MSKEWRDFIKDIVSIVVIAFILAMLLRTFVVEARVIPSGSMLPTIEISDRVMVCKFIYYFKEPEHGDIIVFQPPESLNAKYDYIKRVIGLPGDKIEMKDHKVYLNGKPLREPYIAEPLNYEWGPVTVPDGKLLVLGDNRNNSYDSHMWNAWLTRERVKGKAFCIYWPIGHMKLLPREVSFE